MFWHNLPYKKKDIVKTSRYFQVKKLGSGAGWTLLATMSGGSHISANSLVGFIKEVSERENIDLKDLYITTVDTPDGENN